MRRPPESEQDGLSRAIVRVVDRKIDVVQKHAGALLRRGGGDQTLIESVDASVARRRLGLRKDGGDVHGAAASVRQSIEDNRARLHALEHALGEASQVATQRLGSQTPNADRRAEEGEESSELTWSTSEESSETVPAVGGTSPGAAVPPVRGFSAALRAATSKADADARMQAVRDREAAAVGTAGRPHMAAGVRRSVSFHEDDEDEMERRTRALRFAVSSMLPPTSTSHVGKRAPPPPGTVTASTPVSPRKEEAVVAPPGLVSAPVSPISSSPPPGRAAAALPAVGRRAAVARSSSVADIHGMAVAARRRAAKAEQTSSSVTRSAPVSPQSLSRASSPKRGEPDGYASSPLSREGSDADVDASPIPRSRSAMAMRRSPQPSPIMARLARSSSQIQLAKLDRQAELEREAASAAASDSLKIGHLASPASDDGGAMWLGQSKSFHLPPRASSMSPQPSFLARSASVGSPASPGALEPLAPIGSDEAASPSPTIIQRRKGVSLSADTSSPPETRTPPGTLRKSPLTGRAAQSPATTGRLSLSPALVRTPKAADDAADVGLDVSKARLVNKKRIVNYSVGGHSKVVEYHADAPEGVSIGEQAKQLMLKESRRRQEMLDGVLYT